MSLVQIFVIKIGSGDLLNKLIFKWQHLLYYAE